MDTVKEVLAAKGGDVFSVRPGASVFDALEVMADKGVGAVLVVDESGKLVGIFSERDNARKLELRGKVARTTLVRDVMTSEMLGVEPTTTVRECMSLMTARRIRHLPVLDKGKLAGMISIGDVVKTIITEQELMISQQAYMIGQYERSLAGGP
jgi:CBS domain-containing protein